MGDEAIVQPELGEYRGRNGRLSELFYVGECWGAAGFSIFRRWEEDYSIHAE